MNRTVWGLRLRKKINQFFYPNKSNDLNQLVSLLTSELGLKKIDPSLPLSHWALDSLRKTQLVVILKKHLNTPFDFQQFPMHHSLEYFLYHYTFHPNPPSDVSARHAPRVFTLNPKELKILRLMERYPDNPSYDITLCVELNQSIDCARFQKAIQRVHDTTLSLRLQFHPFELTKTIHSSLTLPFDYHAIQTLAPAEQHHLIQARSCLSIRPFSKEARPLYRADLYQLSSERYVFVITMHHLISDGLSLWNYVKKVLKAYHDKPIQHDLHAATHYFQSRSLGTKNLDSLRELVTWIQTNAIARCIPLCYPDTIPYACVTHRLSIATSFFEQKECINAQILHALSETLFMVWNQNAWLLKLNNHARYSVDELNLIGYLADANLLCLSVDENSLDWIKKQLALLSTNKHPFYENMEATLEASNMPEICYNFMDLRFMESADNPCKLYPLNLPKTTMWADEITLVFEVFVTETAVHLSCSGLTPYFSQKQLDDLAVQMEKNLLSNLTTKPLYKRASSHAQMVERNQ